MAVSRMTVVALLIGGVAAGMAARRVRHHFHRTHAHAEHVARSGPTWTPPALKVPTERPRLWWTRDRLARARTWAKGHPLHPRDDDPAGQALAYLLADDREAGRRAVDWLMGLTLNTEGVASDGARWFGENAMLVYDWCHDLISAEQRRTLIERWNRDLEALNRKPWGGAGMEGNNYYWGYLRNSFEWGVASAHENPQAAHFVDEALSARFGKGFVPYAAGPGRGGVLPEGTQYGPYLVGYATVPLVTAANLGVDLWGATDFFREAVYAIVYGTTPAPTTTAGGGSNRFELFPFDDDEKFHEGGSAEREFLSTFMLAASERWRTEPAGQLARAWLNAVNPTLAPMSAAWAGPPPAARPFNSLPLDELAPGPGFFYIRNRWAPDASALLWQLQRADGVGHEHFDWGTFQIWRAGRWLTRETVGYGEDIAGWGAPGASPNEGGGKHSSAAPIGHNALLFEGMAARNLGERRGPPHLVRLESRPEYAYAAVDLSDSYRCSSDCRPERDENFYVGQAVRELVFLRGLETLVILDRAEASDEKKPAAAVVRTVIVHAEQKPTIDGHAWVAVSGDQALRGFSLAPSGAVLRAVAEGGPVGQQRVEIDGQGAPLVHFVTVLQARGARDPDLIATLSESPNELTVRLQHPTRGSVSIVFTKGAQSRGGRIGFGPPGPAPAASAALRADVQPIGFGVDGPAWH